MTYHYHSDEVKMLESFLYWWEQNTPDVITGWNVRLYDIPYLCGRMSRIMGEKKMKQLSPWKMVDHEMIGISGREYNVYSIVGVTTLDYLELYKKFTYVNRESYRLDFIGEVELGQKKLDHSEFDTFKDFYKGTGRSSLTTTSKTWNLLTVWKTR